MNNKGYKGMDEYVGKDIGIYHVESVCDKKDKDGHKLYHVKCRYCEYESDMRLYNIKQPTICRHKDRTGRQVNFKPFWENERLKHIFMGMKRRCFNSNDKSYRWYGAKGISICSEWLDNPKAFEEWALNNGFKESLTIDRIDENKDYSPDNCRWISMNENTRKAGKVNWLSVNNITLTGRQWAEKLNVSVNIINTAIREYGIDKTKELISAMLKESPTTKHRRPNQSWFSVYGIQI